MSDTMQQMGQESHPPRANRWTRTHTIWALMVISLIPGFVVALFRDHWQELPAGVRAAIYLMSATLIVAAVSLILTGSDEKARQSRSESLHSTDDS